MLELKEQSLFLLFHAVTAQVPLMKYLQRIYDFRKFNNLICESTVETIE